MHCTINTTPTVETIMQNTGQLNLVHKPEFDHATFARLESSSGNRAIKIIENGHVSARVAFVHGPLKNVEFIALHVNMIPF